jgi:hypothetical protein
MCRIDFIRHADIPELEAKLTSYINMDGAEAQVDETEDQPAKKVLIIFSY